MSGPDARPPTMDELDMQTRRERLKPLLARRMHASEIASVLGVTVRTIRRDIAVVRQEMAESLSKKDAVSVAGDVLLRSDTRQRELWAMFAKLTGADARSIGCKVAILRELRAEAKEEVELLQKLGIVYQAPREVMIGIQAIAALRLVPEDQLEALAMLPQPQFLKQLAAFVGEETVDALIDAPATQPGEQREGRPMGDV